MAPGKERPSLAEQRQAGLPRDGLVAVRRGPRVAAYRSRAGQVQVVLPPLPEAEDRPPFQAAQAEGAALFGVSGHREAMAPRKKWRPATERRLGRHQPQGVVALREEP